MISYEGIDEATLIHGLYHGTRAQGIGMLHDAWALTVEQVRADISSTKSFDYYRGRPLKVRLDTEAKTFNERGYDMNAGQGAAARVVDSLRKQAA